MSIELIVLSFRAEITSPAAKLVLLKLADNANDGGICWPSVATVARQTSLSVRAVRENLRRLEELGLIETIKRRQGEKNLSNVYKLRLWGHPLVKTPDPAEVRQEMPEGTAAGAGGTAPDAVGVRQQVPPNLQLEPSIEPPSKSGRAQRADIILNGHAQDFERFYATYPNRKGRGQAIRAFKTALKKTTAEILIAGAARYAADPSRKPEFTKHPSTWLNAECWADDADLLKPNRWDTRAWEAAGREWLYNGKKGPPPPLENFPRPPESP